MAERVQPIKKLYILYIIYKLNSDFITQYNLKRKSLLGLPKNSIKYETLSYFAKISYCNMKSIVVTNFGFFLSGAVCKDIHSFFICKFVCPKKRSFHKYKYLRYLQSNFHSHKWYLFALSHSIVNKQIWKFQYTFLF